MRIRPGATAISLSPSWSTSTARTASTSSGGIVEALEAANDLRAAVVDLVLVPGLELSDNCDDPDLSAHALALGLDEHIAVDGEWLAGT
jgi:hypothetical protein